MWATFVIKTGIEIPGGLRGTLGSVYQSNANLSPPRLIADIQMGSDVSLTVVLSCLVSLVNVSFAESGTDTLSSEERLHDVRMHTRDFMCCTSSQSVNSRVPVHPGQCQCSQDEKPQPLAKGPS